MGSVANLSTPKNGEILIAATQVCGRGVQGLAAAKTFRWREGGALAGGDLRGCGVFTGVDVSVICGRRGLE